MIFSLLGVDRILCDRNLIVSKTKALSLICNANIRESAFFVRAKFRVYGASLAGNLILLAGTENSANDIRWLILVIGSKLYNAHLSLAGRRVVVSGFMIPCQKYCCDRNMAGIRDRRILTYVVGSTSSCKKNGFMVFLP